jgi:hypothetical protein
VLGVTPTAVEGDGVARVGLRRLQAAFGFVEVLPVVGHQPDQDDDKGAESDTRYRPLIRLSMLSVTVKGLGFHALGARPSRFSQGLPGVVVGRAT